MSLQVLWLLRYGCRMHRNTADGFVCLLQIGEIATSLIPVWTGMGV